MGKIALAIVVAVTGLVVAPSRADAVGGVTSVASGFDQSCALTVGGAIYCWGRNNWGQLGNGTTTNSSVPALVSGVHNWTAVSAGVSSTCALDDLSEAYCWGANADGQLGDGTNTDSSIPVAVVGGHTWRSISVGERFVCAVTPANVAYCWGRGNNGQLGGGTGLSSAAPQLVSGGLSWASVNAGIDAVACGVTTGGAGYCWGLDGDNRLGNGPAGDSSTPTLVSGGLTWSDIVGGSRNTCGVTTAGAAYCWGLGGTPSNGDLSNATSDVPVLVSGGLTWARLRAGDAFMCGFTTAGAGYCWGANGLGAVGDGSGSNSSQPTAISGSYVFTAMSTTGAGGCGVTPVGALYCWGWNAYGTVGDGSTTNRTTPVAVAVFASSLASATVTGVVDPSLTFTVAGRATVCNGQSSAGFQTGSTSTSVSLGHLNPTVIGGGAQDLTLATNAGGGFVVYIRTSGTTPNAFRTSGGSTVADVSGTHASPSASTTAGTAGFGYTTNDATIAFGSNNWAKITSLDESVMSAGAGVMSKSACTAFQATVAATTAAGSYSAPIVYTAVPSF